MSVNLFKIDGPLTEKDQAYYVEREADVKILSHVRSNDYILIREPRQQGKTSLIKRLMANPALENVIFVYVDITILDRSKETTWYQTLCQRILRQLQTLIPSSQWPLTPQNVSEWRDFLWKISSFGADANKSIVVIMDEVGAIEFPGSTKFFSVLREVFTSREYEIEFQRLIFVLVGTFHPQDLIKDNTVSPFNIAQRIDLPDFNLKQVNKLVSKGGWQRIEALTKKIWYWTDGQPYLTQLICSYLPLDATATDVDDSVEQLCHEDTLFLPMVLKQLNKDDRLYTYVKRILSGDLIRFYPAEAGRQSQLEMLGILKDNEEGYCKIRNRIINKAISDLS